VADTAYAHHDWAHAEAGYGVLVMAVPASPRFWYRLGFARQSLGRFPEAAEAYRHADALGAPPAYARYNLACALARAGQADSALAVLQRLMDSGYGDTRQLQEDADLASVRTDARFAAVLERSRHNAQPCALRAESRQFDFWIGDWDVTQNVPGGGAAGDSHVEIILNQCVIFENWTGRTGGSGKSFNAWNADLACWQQNWMDDRGDVTNYTDGHFADGRLVFHAEKKNAAGQWQKHRLTFVPIDADHVRQLGETSTDAGATWTATYDLLYTRKR
jgi:tetratricopeptide (TPR) repeat protein